MTIEKRGFIFQPVEHWTLKAVGNKPEVSMISMFCFDLELGELLELKMNEDTFNSAMIPDNAWSKKDLQIVKLIFDQEYKSSGLSISLTLKEVKLDKKVIIK